MTLKRHLVLLLVVTTLISLIVQGFYFLFIYNQRINEARNASFAVLRQTDLMLDDAMGQVSLVGQTVATSSDLQSYLLYKKGISGEALDKQIIRLGYLRSFLRSLVSTNDVVADVIIADVQDGLLSYSGNFSFAGYHAIKSNMNLMECEAPFFVSLPETELTEVFPSCAFVQVLPINHTAGLFSQRNDRLGYGIVAVRQSALQSIIDHSAGSSSYVAIADAGGQIIVESAAAPLSSIFPSVEELISRSAQFSESDIIPIKHNGVKYFASIHQNAEIGWYTISLFPESVLYKNTGTLIPFGLLLALINLLCVFFIGGGMVRSSYKQIKNIIESLKYVNTSQGKYRLQRSSHLEFNQISTAINTMLDGIDDANQQILQFQSQLYENKLLQQQIELKALQSQINPHFLFNTLECIRSIARLRGVDEISVLTSSMANIFRYSISDNIESTVQAECDCITDYFSILSIRHPDKFKMELNVDEALYPCHILKMCLQPLMENTIKHAMEETEDSIMIRVSSSREEDHFLLTFHDSGTGISPQRLEEVRQGLLQTPVSRAPASGYTGVGLSNINARLKLYYGPAYGLTIDSPPMQGTTITLRLPLIPPGQPMGGA